MSTESDPSGILPIVLVGLLSGSIGGAAMGVVLHFGANAMPFIGSLYGGPTVAGGWLAHLVNSAIFGVIFAYVVTRPVLRERITGLDDYIVSGVVYATLVGLLTVGVLVPIAIRSSGLQELPQPIAETSMGVGALLLALSIGIAHVLYGIILGVAYERLEIEHIPVPSEKGIPESGVLDSDQE